MKIVSPKKLLNFVSSCSFDLTLIFLKNKSAQRSRPSLTEQGKSVSSLVFSAPIIFYRAHKKRLFHAPRTERLEFQHVRFPFLQLHSVSAVTLLHRFLPSILHPFWIIMRDNDAESIVYPQKLHSRQSGPPAKPVVLTVALFSYFVLTLSGFGRFSSVTSSGSQ